VDELEGSHRFMELARAAIDYNEAIVERHDIQCVWGRRGKYHAAVTPRGTQEILVPFMTELNALGEPYRLVEGDDLAAEIGTPYYSAAVYTPGCVLMNPAALCKGLADTLPSNVTHYEQTPVTGVDYGNGVIVTTKDGSIRAPKMILTVNGFAGEFGHYKGHLLNFAGYLCLSRNSAPGFGEVAPGVYTAACQNAVGATKGTIGGILVADMACGEDNPLIAHMESLGTPDILPPRPLSVGTVHQPTRSIECSHFAELTDIGKYPIIECVVFWALPYDSG
jgi:glycine/D-amino acid oxidase-like deaminating enzyme